MKTCEQAAQELRRRGETVSAWAAKHGFKAHQVRAVLGGQAKGNWGVSHQIAVLLGIKDGEIVVRPIRSFRTSDSSGRQRERGRLSDDQTQLSSIANLFNDKGVMKWQMIRLSTAL